MGHLAQAALLLFCLLPAPLLAESLIIGPSAMHRHDVLDLSGIHRRASDLHTPTNAIGTHSRSRAVMLAKPSQPVPRNVKDTVSALRAAVQEGLKAQQSRMDVDLPFASRLGIEVTDDDKNKKTATPEDVARSDRELARLFVEMFDVIGDQVVIAFNTDEEAQKARKVWAKGAPYKGKVTSMNPKTARGPKLKRGPDAVMGFAKMVEEKKRKQAGAGGNKGKKSTGEAGSAVAGKPAYARIVPSGTEVLLVVAPKQAELMTVQKLSKGLGQGCLIVLLNARLHQGTSPAPRSLHVTLLLVTKSGVKAKFFDDEQREFYEREFQSMFHLRPVGPETDDFLYRAYPMDWTVARKPKIGPPKVLYAQDRRPSQAEIAAAMDEGDKTVGVFGNLF